MMKRVLSVFLLGFFCFISWSEEPPAVDLQKVRETWLKWNNEERAGLGLHPYKYDLRLEKSALRWSQISKARGEITHKRDPADPQYYNYKAITAWFAEQGLVFKNIKGYTHTENIGWGYFNYRGGDYTEELIKAIRSTFDFFMAEKFKTGKWETAHYRSITAPHFYYLGIGIVVDKAKKRYYITIHYGSELE